jgi:hypothetical protein
MCAQLGMSWPWCMVMHTCPVLSKCSPGGHPAWLSWPGKPIRSVSLTTRFISQACVPGRVVVAAWGCHGALYGRGAAVARALAAQGVRLMCLGTTKGGQLLHPSRLPAAARLIPYEPHASVAP